MYLIRNNKIHILDINDLVNHFNSLSSHYVNTYLISPNEVDDIFDYCIHKAVSTIARFNIPYNGTNINSGYIDKDLYESIYIDIGEYYINELYSKMGNYGILEDLCKVEYTRCKLIVNGITLWLFLGSRGKDAKSHRNQAIRSY